MGMHSLETIEKIRIKAIERAKNKNPIQNILQNPDWRKKSDLARVESGNSRKPHKKNRKLLTIPDDLFQQEVLVRGVLGSSRLWGISQSSIRERAWKLGII